VELLGRSDTNIWLTIDRPDGYGTCWVEKSRLTVSGDTSDLPVEFAPPWPTAEPTLASGSSGSSEPACSTYTYLSCPQPRCKAVKYTSQIGGYCTNPWVTTAMG